MADQGLLQQLNLGLAGVLLGLGRHRDYRVLLPHILEQALLLGLHRFQGFYQCVELLVFGPELLLEFGRLAVGDRLDMHHLVFKMFELGARLVLRSLTGKLCFLSLRDILG